MLNCLAILLALPVPQEVQTGFEVLLEPLAPPTEVELLRTVTLDDRVAVLSRAVDAPGMQLDMLDAAGNLLWRRLTPGTLDEGTPAIDSTPGVQFRDLVASSDRTQLILLTMEQQNETAYRSVLEGFDAGSGDLNWRRKGDLTGVGTSAPSATPTYARLAAGGGQIAVSSRRSSSDYFGTYCSGGLSAFSDATGAKAFEVDFTQNTPSLSGLTVAPQSGLVLFEFGECGFNRDFKAHSLSSGSGIWASSIGGTPSTPLTGGARRYAYSGDESVMVRVLPGQYPYGLNTATGNKLWGSAGSHAFDDVVAVGQDRFFLAGELSLGQGAVLRAFKLVDSATGSLLWQTVGSATLPAGVEGGHRVRVAHSPGAGLLGFAGATLTLLDEVTGAVVAEAPLAQPIGTAGELATLSDGTWIVAPSPGGPGPVEAFRADGSLRWSYQPTSAWEGLAHPIWAAGTPETGELHAVTADVDPTSPYYNLPAYSRHSAATGERLGSFLLQDHELGERDYAVSPAGDRLASIQEGLGENYGSPSPLIQVRLVFTDTATGESEVVPTSTSSGADDSPMTLAWGSDSSHVFGSWSSDSGGSRKLFASRTPVVQPGATWVASIDGGAGAVIANPVLAVSESSWGVFAFARWQNGAERGLALARLDASTGAVLAQRLWEGPGDGVSAPFQVFDRPRALFLDEGRGLGYAVSLIGNLGQAVSVAQFALDDLQILQTLELPFSALPIDLSKNGAAMSSDGTRLLLGWGASDGPPLQAACVDLEAMEPLWSRALEGSNAVESVELALLNDRVGLARLLGDGGSAELVSLDLRNGAVLTQSQGLDAGTYDSAGPPPLAIFGRSLLELGGPGAAQLRPTEFGSLLVAPDCVEGAPLQLVVDAGEAAAGRAYWVLGSRSGTAPGLDLGAVLLPLVVDGYTASTVFLANTGPFEGTLGLLDEQGTAGAEIAFPPIGAAWVGSQLHHAAVVFDPLTLEAEAVSAAVSMPVGIVESQQP